MLLGLSEVTKPEARRDRGGVWFALEHAQLHIGVDPDAPEDGNLPGNLPVPGKKCSIGSGQ